MSDEQYTACFGDDDFEQWWSAGWCDTDCVSEAHMEALYESCVYIASAESRHMVQSADELRKAIKKWANKRNEAAERLRNEN
jgi:hypothetical protein